MNKIVLAGQDFDVPDLPFGKVRLVMAKFKSMSGREIGSDESMGDAVTILATIIGKTDEEINAMPIKMNEVMVALEQIPGICGMERVKPGEAPVAATTTSGTDSTAT
jgi:hypothetical protein